jgi:hypothetical protein
MMIPLVAVIKTARDIARSHSTIQDTRDTPAASVRLRT